MTETCEIERRVLGELLNYPESYLEARQLLRSSEMFADLGCRRMFDVVTSEYELRGDFSYESVSMRAKSAGLSEAFVLEVFTSGSGANKIGIDARLLVDFHIKRQSVQAALAAVSRWREGEDIYEVLNGLEDRLSELRELWSGSKIAASQDIVLHLMDEADKISKGEKPDTTPFGFYDLDAVTGGMDSGDLVVIAAPEKSGKTTMMLQIVLHNARQGRPTMIYSTEMRKEALFQRMALIETGLSLIAYKHGRFTEEEWARYSRVLAEFGSLPLFVREGNFTVLDILAESKQLVQKSGIKLIAVDYIQRIEPMQSRKVETREREVAAISAALKSLAMECRIPVLALSQVNEDLRARESRAIEQDMDRMITIGPAQAGNQADPLRVIDLRVRQRMGVSGSMGEVKLMYDLRTGSWKNYSEAPKFRASRWQE